MRSGLRTGAREARRHVMPAASLARARVLGGAQYCAVGVCTYVICMTHVRCLPVAYLRVCD
eukprot:1138092-Prymnesium_polylepis.1